MPRGRKKKVTSYDKAIEDTEKELISVKNEYDAITEKLKDLRKQKRESQKEELFQAVERSRKSYEEILSFIKGTDTSY